MIILLNMSFLNYILIEGDVLIKYTVHSNLTLWSSYFYLQ